MQLRTLTFLLHRLFWDWEVDGVVVVGRLFPMLGGKGNGGCD